MSIFPRSSARSGEVKLVIDKPNNEVDFAYVGIKGVDEGNKFEVKFDDCAEVICSESNASLMRLNIAVIVMSHLLRFWKRL